MVFHSFYKGWKCIMHLKSLGIGKNTSSNVIDGQFHGNRVTFQRKFGSIFLYWRQEYSPNWLFILLYFVNDAPVSYQSEEI